MKKLLLFLILAIALPCFADKYEVLYVKKAALFGCKKIINIQPIPIKKVWGKKESTDKVTFGLCIVDINPDLYKEILFYKSLWAVKTVNKKIVVYKFIDKKNKYGNGVTNAKGDFIIPVVVNK